ncbi:U-box domain-containing protein 34-like [Arachis hypogaea]|uniref:U-box domain-containing protein 34-like n=1 Tax=Arachis hypogaea TaxID=3818 RepID=UPI003B21B878
MVDFRKSASAKPKNSGGPTTVIAVTSGRKSQYAIQWAVEHILKKNSSCILIHVQTNPLSNKIINGVGPSHCRPPTEEEWQRIFLPFRGLCARKGIVATELVLQGANVTSALTQYVNENYISSVIVGASQWNSFISIIDFNILGVDEYEKAKLSRQKTVHAMENEENQGASSSAYIYKNIVPYRRYNIKEIEIATNYFDIDLKIGEGGYGPVFKGVIDNTDVAIKAVRPDISHGERQFNQEVQVLSTITHPNMVLLIGACPEFGCLVYEYMDYGSLEDRLFRKGNTPPIPWKIRFRIASEIATALLYLHQLKPEPLVHRDLKPANILLDRTYLSKIGDVGLARLVPPSVADKTTQYRLTKAAGTFCYIDPEYQQTGLLGVKSDIYSFGVMLLQIITAKPPMGLAHLVQSAIDAGSFEQVLDPSLNDWPVEDALSCAKLALKCCEMRKRDRPSLATVILPELNRLRDLR